MEGKKKILFLSLLVLTSCAASFPYRWYGLDCQECAGTLLAKDKKDDLPLSTCLPDADGKGTCAVLTFTEMDRLRSDYMEMQERLKACDESLNR